MKIKKVICLIITVVMLFAITGCGGSTETKPVEIAKVPNVSKDKLVITYSTRTVSNDVVFYLKNKGDIDAHDIVVEVEFWKKATASAEEFQEEDDGFTEEGADKKTDPTQDTYVGSTKVSFEFIKKDYTVAGLASTGNKEYDYYKIFIDINEETTITNKYEYAYNDLIVEDNTILNPTDEQIAEGIERSSDVLITLKNKGETRINFIEIAVVYYKDNEIIGYNKKQKQNLDGKIKSTLKVSFPIGKSYSDRLDFDTYRVFINRAYKAKY